MYDRHPSITVITGRVASIDFYRLIDTIDNVYVIDIDSYRFIERFSDIDFYRLPTSGLNVCKVVSKNSVQCCPAHLPVKVGLIHDTVIICMK